MTLARKGLARVKSLLKAELHRCLCRGSARSDLHVSSSNAQSITNGEIRLMRNEMFETEKQRQLSLVKRIEKIKVEYRGLPEDCTLVMNKGLSTPFNCAMHMQELLMTRTALALVNDVPWDMHRPIVEDCELRFLHFTDENPKFANIAFWRSGSFILGHVLETSFKDDYYVELCSFPPPNVRSGSFVYDADIKIPDWKPTQTELRCLGQIGARLHYQDYKFERLDIDVSLALRMFHHNRFKSLQIPQIAAQSQSGNDVTIYRVADHIDISRGPLIATTKQIGRFGIAAVHDIESEDLGPMKRFQGIAIPSQLPLHYWTFEYLFNRAMSASNAPIPSLNSSRSSKPSPQLLEAL